MLDLVLPDPNDISLHSGWDLDFRQLDPGTLETQVRIRPGDGVTLLAIAMDRAVHQRGLPPNATRTFGLPADGAIRNWGGSDLQVPGMLTFNGSSGFEGVSSGEFSGITVTVSEAFLVQVGRAGGRSWAGV